MLFLLYSGIASILESAPFSLIGELSEVALRTLIASTIACLMTGAIAGMAILFHLAKISSLYDKV